ncbi:MAG TPA: hypothetical protein VED46_01925 [Alphaproteobacteria bacterium]|jgi:hypothetical protein|nr:hypothetical protein [Alphaproteobacteria bacterium]
MRILMFCAALLCAISPGLAVAQEGASSGFAGEYVMAGKGFHPSDAPYVGTCSIAADDQAYRVSCYNEGTQHTYIGKGLGIGDTLAIYIGDELRGDHGSIYLAQYLVVYQRQPDGSLKGTWLHTESPAAGAETLQPK